MGSEQDVGGRTTAARDDVKVVSAESMKLVSRLDPL
jgi:hypothetical protein